METITNAVSTVTSTVTSTASKLVYGDQAKPDSGDTTKTENNGTGGKEPISGEQGSGTIAEPFDKGNAATPLDTTANKSTFLDDQTTGNDAKATAGSSATDEDFLKLNPVLDGPKDNATAGSSGAEKSHTNQDNETNVGMPIVPINPDAASSGPGTTSQTTSGSTGTTDKAGVSDKLWKDTPLDDISRSGAPGAGPPAPDHVTVAAPTSSTSSGPDSAIKTSAPDAVTAASSTYGGTGAAEKTQTHGIDAAQGSTTFKTQDGVTSTPRRDTPEWATTDVPSGAVSSNAPKPSTETSGLASEKSGRKSESGKSPALGTSTSNEEKGGKMSHLKEKLKDKLHIGSKDK